MLTERDISIVAAVVRYYVLSRHQVQRLFFPSDDNGRLTRKRLQMLVSENFISRQKMLYCAPLAGAPASVYYPAQRGLELLAEHFQDDRFLSSSVQPPIHHHIFHWLAVSETHVVFDHAMALQQEAQIEGWINEYDTVSPGAATPDKKYRLYTLITEKPKLVCAPDAGLLLACKGAKKVFYLEQDRATSGVQQIASGKSSGYAAMAEHKLHQRHFPEENVGAFSVLMIAPTDRRRDALCSAFKEKPGAALWRFASVQDATPDKILYQPIWYGCHKAEPDPLIRGS